jgi:hypothetical protein
MVGCKAWNPASFLKSAVPPQQAGELEQIAPQLAVAIGAAAIAFEPMPIRINLLAEALAAEDARRRDPVKRTLWICGSLVAVMLLWGGYAMLQQFKARQSAASEESAWKQNEASFQSITKAQSDMATAERKLQSLTRYSTNRFLWAPVLNGFQKAVVAVANDVQLEQIRGTQTYDAIPGTPASKDKKTPAKPAAALEHIGIVLRARDYGNPNDANYNKLKSALNSEGYLKSVLQKNEGVRLSSTLAGPIGDPLEPSKTFYQFTLECRVQEMRRDE